MSPDPWPHRPPPPATGPRFHLEIRRPAELRTLRAALRSWCPEALGADDPDGTVLDTLLLAVDELASNGLRHGGAPVSVTVAREDRDLLLVVADEDPEHGPRPAVDRDPAHGGMGLPMVAGVTTTRGWTAVDDRKHVWACIPTDQVPTDRAGERSHP